MDSYITGLLTIVATIVGFLTNYLIESHKSRSERKNHISKTRFDKEFEIYQELSEKNLTMIYDAGEAVINTRVKEGFDKGTSICLKDNKNEILADINKHIDSFVLHCNEAEFINKRYAPFINKKVFDSYNQLAKYSKEILSLYSYYIRYDNDIYFTFEEEHYDKNSAKAKIEEIQKDLSKLSDQTIDDVRNYLNKLDVKEY